MFRICWQVWIAEIGKKDYQNAKKIKKNSTRWNLWRTLDFKCLCFLEKCSLIFQNSLIKSLILKIEKQKTLKNFFTNTDRRNWKENVKNNKKIKKHIVNLRNLKKKYFTYPYFF